ncbi:MAG TPA: UDP-N-acetylmuramoyl-tripeptide--D-alanyl-D-alanine ligase [Thermoanaerobaculia bacterium]|nr:UDP-N-acetylmuramoyl-tripeptide--D-alanyl-D-alanine ligase [Thermoanaerobaculia bacterium]
MRLTFSQLAEMTGGEVVQGGDVVTESVVIDSREVRPDSVFFAIKGERLDGHQFLDQALAAGRGAVVARIPAAIPDGKGIVRVDETTAALQRLARSIRTSRPFLLVAVTGSAGKTTTKEMIATLVATERRTWKSWGNFNNLIGCPLCIDNTPDDAEVVVSEMGMNHKGEIEQLARLTRPNIGVYTNIGPVHIEFFGTIEKIAEAKRELLENLADDGAIVVNAGDPQVMRISEGFHGRKVSYGVEPVAADYQAASVVERGLLGSRFVLQAEGTKRSIDLTLPGRHNLENILAAIATARTIGISWEGIVCGIGELRPAKHRGVVMLWRGATIYDDTYNSNPFALGRALDLLQKADARGRRIAVIGDMLELGERELQFHRDAGKAIPREIDAVVGVGPRSRALLDGARENRFPGQSFFHLDDAQIAGEFLVGFLDAGDLVLIKGSRGVGLDRIVTMLEKES